jgi:hypothetical protein
MGSKSPIKEDGSGEDDDIGDETTSFKTKNHDIVPILDLKKITQTDQQ